MPALPLAESWGAAAIARGLRRVDRRQPRRTRATVLFILESSQTRSLASKLPDRSPVSSKSGCNILCCSRYLLEGPADPELWAGLRPLSSAAGLWPRAFTAFQTA